MQTNHIRPTESAARVSFVVPDAGVDAIISAVEARDAQLPLFVYERIDPISREPLTTTMGLRVRTRDVSGEPFGELRDELAQAPSEGGVFAMIGYPDNGSSTDSKTPAAVILQLLEFIQIDHRSGHGEVVGVDEATDEEGLAAWARLCSVPPPGRDVDALPLVQNWTASVDLATFRDAVEGFKSRHAAGDVEGVVLSVPMASRTRSDPIASYRTLRRINPSTCMFAVRSGEFALWGATSLSLAELDAGHLVAETDGATHPIPTTIDGSRYVWEPSAKELEEYDVVARALWDDLLPVTLPGTLRFTRDREERRFFGLGHLFAEVSGQLATGIDGVAAVEALSPHGAAVGYPRREAMAAIDELEHRARGPFAGVIGLFRSSGAVDAAAITRSMWTTLDGSFTQAGAKVVRESDPAAEYEESVLKTQALRESARSLSM